MWPQSAKEQCVWEYVLLHSSSSSPAPAPASASTSCGSCGSRFHLHFSLHFLWNLWGSETGKTMESIRMPQTLPRMHIISTLRWLKGLPGFHAEELDTALKDLPSPEPASIRHKGCSICPGNCWDEFNKYIARYNTVVSYVKNNMLSWYDICGWSRNQKQGNRNGGAS